MQFTPLLNAAVYGELEVAKWLCEAKADVECKDKVRMMCVFRCCTGMFLVFNHSACSCVVYMCYEWLDVSVYYCDDVVHTNELHCSLVYCSLCITVWTYCSDNCMPTGLH